MPARRGRRLAARRARRWVAACAVRAPCAFPSAFAALRRRDLVGGVPGQRGDVQVAVATVSRSVRDRDDEVPVGAGWGDLQVGGMQRVLARVAEADAGTEGF